jgi:UDP-N-acetyl-D-mannosaminuronate dehydrogenase
MEKIVVVGLGEIGKPLHNILKNAYRDDVVGVDIAPVEISGPVGIMHVCIPFQLDRGFVKIVTDYCMKYRPGVVVINSTVTPGTTEEIEKSSGIPSVYSPVRGKHTRMESELLSYVKFIAGNSAKAVEIVEKHFTAAGMKTQRITVPGTLELSKLLETTYFGLLIAWAQEMDRLSRSIGGDYQELVKFFQEISYLPPYVFQPGFIGGHCVMPNIELLRSKFTSDFLETIKNSNIRKGAELSGDTAKLSERIEPVKIDTRNH